MNSFGNRTLGIFTRVALKRKPWIPHKSQIKVKIA